MTIFIENNLNLNKYNCILDKNFNPLFIINKFNSIALNIQNKRVNETLKLKKSYIEFPYFSLKSNVAYYDDEWIFKNIYNHYFCFCKGPNCLSSKISENCIYYFYLNIIDINRDIYKKTDYLFIDFIFVDQSSDDTYPIFKEMIKEKLPVHYITEKKDIWYIIYIVNKLMNV